MARTAKKDNGNEPVSLVPEDPNVPRPRLHKLVIKNFRAIGAQPVEIALDEIVVLVGPNNSGKSSILRAYDVVMKQGSNEGKLETEDFPNGIVDANALPEIELQTVVFDKAPGERWIGATDGGEMLIREKWIWNSPNAQPKRQGFDVQKDAWDDQVPWGAPAVANSRRPLPHRIEAFASPEVQANEISSLLMGILKDRIKTHKSGGDVQERSDYDVLMEAISGLQKSVVESTKEEIDLVEGQVSALLEKVFPKYRIKLDAKPEVDPEKTYTPFKATADLLMGPQGGYFSKISQQGSGARRTLLWTALKYVSETKMSLDGGSRPHVLLLDEPEICLHPGAIREARTVLYDLPKTGRWQVMVTTHSPVFIDLSRDNTTIVRVERTEENAIRGVTLYRPNRSELDKDDRKNLKALNVCDPYVNEFFFGGRVVVVEGDTEYTAFSLVRDLFYEKYRDLHVVRARGKGIIATIAKILNQFSSSYAILHDSDRPQTDNGKNPAWGMNSGILDAVNKASDPKSIGLIACVANFEEAIFGKEVKTDKPYNAFVRIRDDSELQAKVCDLLDALLDSNLPVPKGCTRWNAIDQLEAALAT
ncbi:ATP-dependent nuclease [Burkholderia glumae]|uniref:ATP-dependent nuclease n=1 Tax=Burkholderia glumae TaxID=337 RepID=UPI0009B88AD5|nr:AAA family ATPase [Burkholderia glumae]MCM2539092.1 AAA family ATPase [Burkholderia glumae]